MAGGYALALQGALVSHLKADPVCVSLVGGRVYDKPPSDAERPFLRIGGIQPRPVRSDGGRGATVAFSIEASSRPLGTGRVEATQCSDAVEAALENTTLTVEGFEVVQLHWLTTTVAEERTGEGYLAIAAFSILLDG